MTPSIRIAPVVVVVALGGVAIADPLPGGGEIEFVKLLIHEDGDELLEPSTPEVRDRYFNLAHCVCSAAGQGDEQSFGVQLTLENSIGQSDRPLEIWLGTMCDDEQQRPLMCSREDSAGLADLDVLAVSPTDIEIPLIRLMEPTGGTACQERELDGTVWAMVDTNADSTLDYNKQYTVTTDTQPPPIPPNIRADGAEGAIEIEWDAPTERAEDIAYFQALCARTDDGTAALPAASHGPRYQSARQLCMLDLEVGLDPVDPTAGAMARVGATPGPMPDAAVDAAPPPDAEPPPPPPIPEAMARLDATFICGEANGAATSMRIEGLENGVDYTVVLIAIDQYANVDGIYFNMPLTPQPVVDFWEDIHDRGTEIEGGFCLIAETYGGDGPIAHALRGFRDGTLAESAFGRWLIETYYELGAPLAAAVRAHWWLQVIAAIVLAPFVVLALLWHVLTLPGLVALIALAIVLRRRRRKLAVAAALVLASTPAAAQPAYDPYWSDRELDVEDYDAEIGEVHWHVGLKFGPYIPAIDEQFDTGDEPGPYAVMFGGYNVLPVLEVDWIFLRGSWGQLGAGGSIGVLGKTAAAYEAESMPDQGYDRPRSEGDETTFRMIPLAATAIYRFTFLDDRWGVPVIPYLRGGLGYYIWWIGAPDGDVAEVFPDGCDPMLDPSCEPDKARGGTIGYVGSIGLAVRAERVDHDAARSMREGGIEHAGFYAELHLGQIDGFGNEKKLSLGDRTWFAGVDFEF
jgi:hypothetical protein